jgi:hypothetical protein
MNNPIVNAVLKTGLVDPAILDEMRRWGIAVDLPDPGPPPLSPDELAGSIQVALESEGYVLVRETDLEVLQQYAATTSQGELHLVLDDDQGHLQDVDVPVSFGRSALNEYIIPWRSEGVQAALTNGMTFLVDGQVRVYFQAVRELFFGETKAFMICTPATIERLPSLPEPAEELGNVQRH